MTVAASSGSVIRSPAIRLRRCAATTQIQELATVLLSAKGTTVQFGGQIHALILKRLARCGGRSLSAVRRSLNERRQADVLRSVDLFSQSS
jgi:hypothetical protein